MKTAILGVLSVLLLGAIWLLRWRIRRLFSHLVKRIKSPIQRRIDRYFTTDRFNENLTFGWNGNSYCRVGRANLLWIKREQILSQVQVIRIPNSDVWLVQGRMGHMLRANNGEVLFNRAEARSLAEAAVHGNGGRSTFDGFGHESAYGTHWTTGSSGRTDAPPNRLQAHRLYLNHPMRNDRRPYISFTPRDGYADIQWGTWGSHDHIDQNPHKQVDIDELLTELIKLCKEQEQSLGARPLQAS